jgi:phage terminase small subunit
MSKPRFTDLQKRFIDYYISTLNAYESAKRAGYKGNYDTLRNTGSENLAKPYIRQEVDRRLAEMIPSPNETLTRIGEQARGSIEDFLRIHDDFGNVLSMETAKERGKLHLVKKYKETKSTRRDKDGGEYITIRKEVELYPADSALDKLMRYHSLYNDKTRLLTWQDEIVDALRSGEVKPEDIQLIYPDLAAEFFARAGVNVSDD